MLCFWTCRVKPSLLTITVCSNSYITMDETAIHLPISPASLQSWIRPMALETLELLHILPTAQGHEFMQPTERHHLHEAETPSRDIHIGQSPRLACVWEKPQTEWEERPAPTENVLSRKTALTHPHRVIMITSLWFVNSAHISFQVVIMTERVRFLHRLW